MDVGHQVANRAVNQLVAVGIASAVDQRHRRRASCLGLGCRVIEHLWNHYQISQVAVSYLFPRLDGVILVKLQLQEFDPVQPFQENLGPGAARLIDNRHIGGANAVEIEQAENHH